jgi:hypothetical protein
MGFAKIFWGIKVPAARLWKQRSKPGCDCNEDDRKFCPNCGKPRRVGVDIPLLANWAPGLSFGGLDVEMTRLHFEDEGCEVFLGFITDTISEEERYGYVSMLTLPQRGRVSKVLEPLGLWDEGAFQCWVLVS